MPLRAAGLVSCCQSFTPAAGDVTEESPQDPLLCLTGLSCSREIPLVQHHGHRVGQVGLTLLLHLASSPGGNNWLGNDGGGQMVLHNITTFVLKLTPALF